MGDDSKRTVERSRTPNMNHVKCELCDLAIDEAEETLERCKYCDYCFGDCCGSSHTNVCVICVRQELEED